jgi:hypothetical protein
VADCPFAQIVVFTLSALRAVGTLQAVGTFGPPE